MNAYDILTGNYTVFFMVFLRVSAMVLFNPIFNRTNFPAYMRSGFMLIITWVLTSRMGLLSVNVFAETSNIEYVEMMIKELLVGIVAGFVLLMYTQMIQAIAEMIDTQMGLGMAKVFDPITNIQTSMTGYFFSTMFMIYFFIVDGHLAIIELLAVSFDYIPLGVPSLDIGMAGFIIPMFASLMELCLRLVIPFIAALLMLEMSMGILMKAIPQINIFMLNMPMKVSLGVFLLFLFATPASNFIDNYIGIMFDNVIEAVELMSGATA